ncbi:DUF4932 domain-containing protein [Emticicia sp. C21]|uniref:DUF4932 domain-containing protein n=1 Tax=Emticicia sp. C21 TaxID=2302915 RepID=UPI000E344B08|nr:DUF4932 domain-containing protein [Emticicia sp. C21]RFS14190.1 DUF4932 domain-containing protein [Emticicia sp. C21]
MKKLSVLFFMLFLNVFCLKGQADSPIRLSETYELANIILALTEYGKTDQWEVSQQSAYYTEVRAYFAQFSNHPLLTKVNYSRQKWESYLSFRTDSYAFSFNDANHLIRKFPMVTNEGFNPFEENLSLIEDFAKISEFRKFYQAHLSYYQNLAKAYLVSQHYPEMRQFLEKELGKQVITGSYTIVMSPLVGRMNCHRKVNGIDTDFITLPGFLLTGKTVKEASQEEIASGTHMLFTELDHAFVNPLTYKHRLLVRANFDNKLWDAGSGYETDSLATFNEYMTWGLYDIFVEQYFPSVANKVSTDWTLQNETRGFYASALFTKELTTLYHNRKSGQTIKDIYPTFIRQLGLLKTSLSKPLIQACNLDNQTISDTTATFVIEFSEPMNQLLSFEVIRVVEENGKTKSEKLIVTAEGNNVVWSDKGKVVSFQLRLIKNVANHLIFNYPWKTLTPLSSVQGIDLPPYSKIKTTVKSDR